jgi:hypothetical protein
MADGRTEIALARLIGLAGWQVDDDPEWPARIHFAGPADKVGFCIIIEIALGKRRGIERIEDLTDLVDADLNCGALDLCWLSVC